MTHSAIVSAEILLDLLRCGRTCQPSNEHFLVRVFGTLMGGKVGRRRGRVERKRKLEILF